MGDKSIVCSNPNCGQPILYSSGEQFITCPACDTWHMLEEEARNAPVVDNNAYSSPADSYMLPESDNAQEERPRNAYVPPESSVDEIIDYEPYAEAPLAAAALSPAPPTGTNFSSEIPNEYNPEREASEVSAVHEQPSTIAHLQTSTGERLVLKEGKNTIGRQETDLIINDKTVSRRHCVLEVVPAGDSWSYFICDIGHLEGNASTNGVFTGGRSIRLKNYERVQIYINNSVQIGNVSMTLRGN